MAKDFIVEVREVNCLYHPSLEEYLLLAQQGSGGVIPVYERFLADTETPVSLYRKLARGRNSYLLESIEGGERVARYSFLGFEPFLILRNWSDRTEMEGEGKTTVHYGSPFGLLRQTLEQYAARGDQGLPRFYGGAVGYFGYETVRHLERIRGLEVNSFSPAIPNAVFLLTEVVVIFDHVRRDITVVVNTRPGADPETSYRAAQERIETILRAIGQTDRTGEGKEGGVGSSFVPEMTRAAFEEQVRRAKEYIRAGDIFQVVLSQRFVANFAGDPFWLYRRLRQINPSPYMFYLDLGDLQLVGASPEMLVRVEGKEVQVRPIAGTRRRGHTEEEDRGLGEELLADEKERAEHVMLVDLGRNDLGRVARFGSVEVTNFMSLERYSHVIHIVSEVKGELREGLGAFDALQACFPAGTVSGAPKVRAMEIIAELEGTPRGPYAGAVGYFGFNGQMDTCITIRTMVLTEGKVYLQTGAGIVADSVPEREYEETLNKARGMMQVLEGC